jgi:ribonuclease HI
MGGRTLRLPHHFRAQDSHQVTSSSRLRRHWTRPITQPDPSTEKVWTIHCDGAWCHVGASAAAVITSPAGVKHRYAARLSFALESDRCTNNIAEYEAVILGLRKLRALGVNTCIVRTDSKVVAGQVEKYYAAKDPALMQYLAAIRSLERQLKGFTFSMWTGPRMKKPTHWPRLPPEASPCPPTCSTMLSARQSSGAPKGSK